MRKSLSVLVLVLVSSCARQSAPPPPPPVDPDTFNLPLAARLDREAHRRPAGTPTAEQVLAALVRGGLPLERHQQVLASTVGAAYCTSAVTEQGVAVAVCEYPAEDAARRGLAYSHQAFDRLIPGRRLLLNRKTLLTMTGAAEAEATQAAQILAAL
jgi:hypothetical protein